MLNSLQQLIYTPLVLTFMSFSALAADIANTTQKIGRMADRNLSASCMPEFAVLDPVQYRMMGDSKLKDVDAELDATQSFSISVHCDAPIMLFVHHKDLIPVAHIWTEQGTQLSGMFRVLNSNINYEILEKGQPIELTVVLSMDDLTTLELVYF
ncbi:hypothetical protein [Acinetobacter courvalinii]|uniref:hypothetical protein n=1 Tax=Acinetobacter courvalinii TaxID=280147 RepID=UPI0021D09CE5|nr:hypothetical protein [Acinetobacter courvalinii]MCU4369588.1 hypothetical protein [Acinetobacter courvalinii]MCU4447793.1 hypothetical protein [Acinetobacter courvalinii]